MNRLFLSIVALLASASVSHAGMLIGSAPGSTNHGSDKISPTLDIIEQYNDVHPGSELDTTGFDYLGKLETESGGYNLEDGLDISDFSFYATETSSDELSSISAGSFGDTVWFEYTGDENLAFYTVKGGNGGAKGGPPPHAGGPNHSQGGGGDDEDEEDGTEDSVKNGGITVYQFDPNVRNLVELEDIEESGDLTGISHISFFTTTPPDDGDGSGDGSNPTPVPTPSAASAGLLGLALVFLARRRRFLLG